MKCIPSLLLFLLLLPLSPAFGQTREPPPEVPRFTFRSMALGYQYSPELYWMDVEFDMENRPQAVYRLLETGRGMRGAAAEIPVRPAPRLYRLSIGDGGQRTYTPVMDLPEQSEDDHLLLILYRTDSGEDGTLFLDDSAEAHPARTVRVVNLIRTNLAVNIGNGPRVIRHRNAVLLGEPVFLEADADRFLLNYGFNVPGRGPWESPSQKLRFRREEQRLLVFYTTLPFNQRNESDDSYHVVFQPEILRKYDRAPAAADDDS